MAYPLWNRGNACLDGYADDTAARAQLSQEGNALVFDDQNVMVRFENVTLTAFDFEILLV